MYIICNITLKTITFVACCLQHLDYTRTNLILTLVNSQIDGAKAAIQRLAADSAAEKLTATMGGILFSALISCHFTGAAETKLVVPSMGASAIPLSSTPYPMGFYHRLDRSLRAIWFLLFIGVKCYQLISDPSSGRRYDCRLVIAAMHLFICMHHTVV